MIKIEKLEKIHGAGRFGSCNSCGVISAEDKTLVRIMASADEKQFSSICLCSKCVKQLVPKLRKRVRKKSRWVVNTHRAYGELFYYCEHCVEGGSELGTEPYCSNCGYQMEQGDRPWNKGIK